jgi:hypothetical protein
MFLRKFPQQTLLSLSFVVFLLSSCGGGAIAVPTADVNAINTAAFETAMAQLSLQFTQTAVAAPSATSLPTNTSVSLTTPPLPTVGGTTSVATTNPGALPTVSFNTTPVTGITQLASPVAPVPTTSLGDACNNNIFIADLTIPDGTVLKPGEDFKKVWQVKNTGNCTWDDGYALVFIGGDQAIDPVNFEIKIEGDFVAPGETADFDIPLTAPLKEGTYQGTWRMKSDSGYFFGTLLTVVFEVKK